MSLVLSRVDPSPVPNSRPSVLWVRGAPFKLSRRFGTVGADEVDAAGAGAGLEEVEATEEMEGLGLVSFEGGDPGAGEGEATLEAVGESVSARQSSRRSKRLTGGRIGLGRPRSSGSHVCLPLAHDLLGEICHLLARVLSQLVHCHSNFRFLRAPSPRVKTELGRS